jgi:hypothetical protein
MSEDPSTTVTSDTRPGQNAPNPFQMTVTNNPKIIANPTVTPDVVNHTNTSPGRLNVLLDAGFSSVFPINQSGQLNLNFSRNR